MPINNNEKSDSVQKCPLSFSQYRVWILQNLYNDDVMYNTSRCFRIEGPLDMGALQKTVDTLVARHEALRARLQIARDGSPFQIMEKEPDLKIEQTDLRNTSEKDIRRLAEQTLQEAVARPFKIYDELMLRIALVRLKETENILLFVKHHLITDYSSWRLFLEEFTTIYTATIKGHSVPLPALKFQYSDFAKAQSLLCTKENLEKKRIYWRNFFDLGSNPEPATETAFPQKTNNKTPCYSSVRQFIPSHIVSECKIIAESRKSTLFEVVLTAIAVLGSYLYNNPKVVLCSANASRQQPGTEHLIGCFFTNVIIALNIRPKQKFTDLIGEVKDNFGRARQQQDMPFEMFTEDLKMECTRRRIPPYRIYVSYRKSAHDKKFNLPETQSEQIDISTGRNTREDIVFNIWERLSEEKLSLELEWLWRTDTFDREMIKNQQKYWRLS